MMNRLILLTCFFIFAWIAAAPASDFSNFWDEWVMSPIVAPTEESWFATATAWDSDDDALYTIHWRRMKALPETHWRWGWEGVIGMADSGKRDEEGTIAGLDFVFGRRFPGLESWPLELLGWVGFQGQTIGFPGGSYINFRLGLAFESALGANVRLRLGYLHLSNANLTSGNEGLDAVWLGLGWARTF